jgi:tRNA nucleotidyltransferase (CCA-adding enzyme)
MNVSSERIQKLLGRDVYAAIKLLGNIAKQSGHSCYLVGGFVRDIILNVPSLDIDLVSDGAITWILEMAKNRSIKKITRSQFSTLKVHFSKGFVFDVARARKEIYPKPASLPVVQPGTLQEDIARRDFTINTLLIDISDARFGLILDFCNGLTDLKKGIIRVLHERSFIDDPTRVFRAIRFKHRFLFRLNRKTTTLLNDAVARGLVKRLTPQRIRRELFLILAEETWDKAMKDLRRLSVLQQLGLRSAGTNRATQQLKRTIRKKTLPVGSPELSRLLAVVSSSSKAEIRRFASRAGLRKSETALLHSVLGARKTILKELSESRISNSRIFTVLEGIADEGLLFLFSIGSPNARKRMEHYHRKLARTKLLITGNDLRELGIKEGPQYARILRKVLMRKLDGKTRSKRDELSLARKLAKQ